MTSGHLTGAALAVVVGSSLAWAALDALRKALALRLPAPALAALLALGQLPAFLLWSAVAGDWRLESAYALTGAATVVLNAVAALLFFAALRASPLSVTIPFLALTPVFATGFSALVLGERPEAREAAGIALVVLGALLVNLRGGEEGGPWRLVHERGSLLMVGVALVWSLTAALDKRALSFAAVPVHAAVQCAGVGLLLLAVTASRHGLRCLRAAREVERTLAVALLVSAVGLGLQFVALRMALVGLVEAVKRAVGLLAAVAVGRLVFGEPVTAGKLAGSLLIAVGVALLTL